MLLPPNKWRKWIHKKDKFEATYLIFEEEFSSSFFNDALYLYRLNYFFNFSTPSYLDLTESEQSNLLLKLEELQRELLHLQSDSTHLLRSLLYYVLIQLDRTYKKTYNIQSEFYKKITILKNF